MDAAASWLWENDAWQPCAGIPVTDRGFRHGMSVFETVGIRNGRPILLDEHLARLREACAQTGLRAIPDDLPNNLPLTDGTGRFHVTAGDGDLLAPINAGRILWLLEETAARKLSSLRLRLHPDPITPLWPRLKTGNYWLNINARREAVQAGFDDAVLVNAQDHIISATSANLFAVIDGLLLTPRPATGARPGVIREWVMAREDVIVAEFHPAQLLEATEIFLTNSGFGIVSVGEIQARAVPETNIGRALRTRYEADFGGR